MNEENKTECQLFIDKALFTSFLNIDGIGHTFSTQCMPPPPQPSFPIPEIANTEHTVLAYGHV